MVRHEGLAGVEVFGYRGAEWHRYSQATASGGMSFLYDGDNVLADIAGGTATSFYVTPFLDQNLSITTDSSTYYYSQDGLGSVRTLTDSSGVLKNEYDYLPFGGAHQPGTKVTVDQRYTYTGRELNPTSDLMYYRYRQYDPRVGRFGGRDPIGTLNPMLDTGLIPEADGACVKPEDRVQDVAWGDSHIYGYSEHNPISFVDPSGLGTSRPCNFAEQTYRDSRCAQAYNSGATATCISEHRGWPRHLWWVPFCISCETPCTLTTSRPVGDGYIDCDYDCGQQSGNLITLQYWCTCPDPITISMPCP
jgi:RHS repeat-associated protein